jgi:hypothetical protein
MSSRNRSTVILFPVFNNYPVRLILANDIERTGRRLGTDLKGAFAAVVTQPDVKGCWLVLGPNGRDADTVSHEAVHVAKALSAWTGSRLDEEGLAYHIGYLVNRVQKFLGSGK